MKHREEVNCLARLFRKATSIFARDFIKNIKINKKTGFTCLFVYWLKPMPKIPPKAPPIRLVSNFRIKGIKAI